jgi:hypothetical protein
MCLSRGLTSLRARWQGDHYGLGKRSPLRTASQPSRRPPTSRVVSEHRDVTSAFVPSLFGQQCSPFRRRTARPVKRISYAEPKLNTKLRQVRSDRDALAVLALGLTPPACGLPAPRATSSPSPPEPSEATSDLAHVLVQPESPGNRSPTPRGKPPLIGSNRLFLANLAPERSVLADNASNTFSPRPAAATPQRNQKRRQHSTDSFPPPASTRSVMGCVSSKPVRSTALRSLPAPSFGLLRKLTVVLSPSMTRTRTL